MAAFIGRDIDIGIGKESTRGTAVAPTFWLQKYTAEVEDKVDIVVDENSLGVIEDSQDSQITGLHGEGSVTGAIGDRSIGLVLLSLFGTVTTQANTPQAGVQTHTFTVAQTNIHQSLTLEMNHANEHVAFALAVVDSLEIRYELGKFIEFSASFMSKGSASAVNSPSYTAENKFTSKHVVYKQATNLAGLGAASAISVKSMTLTIESNRELDKVLGSTAPVDIFNKAFMVSGSVELWYKDTTQKTIYTGGTAKAMRFDLINTDVTIGASTNPSLQINLAKVKHQNWTRSSDMNEIVTESFDFKGFYSLSDTAMISAVLINTTTSY